MNLGRNYSLLVCVCVLFPAFCSRCSMRKWGNAYMQKNFISRKSLSYDVLNVQIANFLSICRTTGMTAGGFQRWAYQINRIFLLHWMLKLYRQRILLRKPNLTILSSTIIHQRFDDFFDTRLAVFIIHTDQEWLKVLKSGVRDFVSLRNAARRRRFLIWQKWGGAGRVSPPPASDIPADYE